MWIKTAATAGTFESSDAMITLEPAAGDSIEIELKSSVEKQYGTEIRRVIEETLRGLGITSARVTVVDKGALNCTLTARTKTAAYRACGEEHYRWEVGIG